MTPDDFQALPGSALIKRAMEIAIIGSHTLAIIDCDGLDAEYLAAFKCIGGQPSKLQIVRCCPCGNWGRRDRKCTCTPKAVTRYRSQLKWQAAMRSDMVVTATPLRHNDIMSTHLNEPAAIVHKRTVFFATTKAHKRVSPDAARLLKVATDKLRFNAKEQIQVLQVTNTIMNMDKRETIEAQHVAEAVQYKAEGR